MISLWLVATLICACGKRADLQSKSIGSLKYARNFSIEQQSDELVLQIFQPYKGGRPITYHLTSDRQNQNFNEQEEFVTYPINKMVATSTSQIGFIDALNAGSLVRGFPTTDFISSPSLRKLIDNGQVVDLGKDSNINMERLIALQPDLLLAYSIGGDLAQWERIQNFGIPVVFDASFLESSPLAQAEWIKMYGALVGKDELADSLFDEIENNYKTLLSQSSTVSLKPSVIGGSVYSGTWFMPGGESWVAQFITDAGGEYLWSDIEKEGSVPLSFEAVYDRSLAADYWIGATAYQSMEHLMTEDVRYAKFKCVREENIYSPTRKTNGLGGNDYYESGVVRPDLVLKDFIKILHPPLLPDHELIYYQKLE